MAQPTPKRDLRTGEPVWMEGIPAPTRFPPMERNIEVDVAVIGCGVSGALAADAALQAGKSVMAFDRRGVALGSTAASTALLKFEIDQPLTTLIRRMGREKVVRAWWRSTTAVDHLAARVADLGLRCGFRERHAVCLPGNVLNVAELRREAAARVKSGLRSRFIEAEELHCLTGITHEGASWSGGTAEVDPVALVRGLWRSVLRRRAAIHTPSDIPRIQPGSDEVVRTTKVGHRVRARHVVLATGYELVKLPQLDTKPEFAWAGCFGESPYGLPAIGPVPGAERCFAVVGFGDNGITFSAIAGQLLQRMLLGLPDPNAALFGFRS